MLFFLAQTAHGAHAGAAHHAAEGHESGVPHIVNWVTLLSKMLGDSWVSDFLVRWEKAIFSVLVIGVISFFVMRISAKRQLIPGRAQMMLEMIVQALDGLVCGVLGSAGRAYTPFIGSLFLYIFVTNLFGLLPLQNSSTAYFTTTLPLAVCVFLYVQWIGVTKNGFFGYLYHMCGSPKDAIGWCLVIIVFPLHVLGEFIKPLSLAFRLYGNIMAGHILMAVFLGLGIGMLKGLHIPAGIPIHFPFLFLEIMVGTIQAFVFALLSTVYIGMMLPHEHEEHAAHA